MELHEKVGTPDFRKWGGATFSCKSEVFTILLHTGSQILHPGCNVLCKLLETKLFDIWQNYSGSVLVMFFFEFGFLLSYKSDQQS